MVIFSFPSIPLTKGGGWMVNEKQKITLRIGLDAGLVDGVQKYKHKNFAQISLDTTDQALFEAGEALGQLFAEELSYIHKVEETQLNLE